jgi:hypothetical protein
MVNALIFMWSLILVVGTIVLLDWWGRRKDGQSKQRPQV